MTNHAHVAVVTLLALLAYFWMSLRVGQGRSKHGVSAPATTGNEDFERLFRAHANTGEWLLIFLPSMWIFAIYVNDLWAAGLGLVWIVGRILYALGYAKEASRRSLGFLIQSLATAVLLFGSLGVIVWQALQHHL
jgi:glutathione S-transferase